MSVPPASAAPPADVLPLLADGALRLEAAPELLPLVRRWLPLLPYAETASSSDGAVIRVAASDPARLPAPSGAPVLRLGAADVWVDDAAGTARLRCTGGSAGEADLARGAAALVPAPGDRAADGVVAWDLFSMCTLASALLLGRMHRALVHAAAIVAPDGGAWLLAGDARAGKSTTSVNLISAGWRFVSDDNVVLFRGADGAVRVEGWPRRFHLDEGWEAGTPLHRRGEVDPHERWPGQWVRTAPLAGLLFPRVAADRPTELAPIPAPDALVALMRQSPWLLADRACAAEVLAFLRSACERPAFSLRLGLDSYRDTDRLLEVLKPLWG
ncbi:MAG TPA: hypothetical protein VGO40_18295 [Longimicrobium sp.]|nr:hypothetical protein [Longimicrobium sp.]